MKLIHLINGLDNLSKEDRFIIDDIMNQAQIQALKKNVSLKPKNKFSKKTTL